LAPELKFLLIKAQIDLKINFLPIKSLINSFKNSIKSINIQIWAFLLKIQIFLLNKVLLLQEYTVKNPIFVFLTSLTDFPTIFWALLPPVIFLTSFGYIFLYIFCGDPKKGYNNGNRSSQLSPNSNIHDLRRSSSVWMLSDWPFIWEWNVVLRFTSVLKARCKSGHNLDVNLRSRSNTIHIGTPWSLITSFTYNLANLSTKYVIYMGKNKVEFVTRSTITLLASW